MVAVLAVALGLLAAGCGGTAGAGTDGVATAGGAKDAGTDDAKAEKDPQQAGLDFARCMREHGVDMPDPEFGGDGFIRVGPGDAAASGEATAGEPTGPPAGFEEADKACRHFLDDLVQDGGGPIDAEAQDRMLKFAECMREHGVDMPDPEFSGGGGRFQARVGGPRHRPVLADVQGRPGGVWLAVRPRRRSRRRSPFRLGAGRGLGSSAAGAS